MSVQCTKDLVIEVIEQFPRCNCPGDILGTKRPKIAGYIDNMLNPALLPAPCTPDVIVPNVIWDGTFPLSFPGFCVWGSDPATDTINLHHHFGSAILQEAGGYWNLTVYGVQGLGSPVIWAGDSPMGSGGACSSPIGLVFTGVAPFPTFCGFPGPVVPATLTLVEA